MIGATVSGMLGGEGRSRCRCSRFSPKEQTVVLGAGCGRGIGLLTDGAAVAPGSRKQGSRNGYDLLVQTLLLFILSRVCG